MQMLKRLSRFRPIICDAALWDAGMRRAGPGKGIHRQMIMTYQNTSKNIPASPHFSVLSLTLPVAMGYIPLGTVFGFLFVQAGAILDEL